MASRVAIEVIDDGGIERHLSLEHRLDHRPRRVEHRAANAARTLRRALAEAVERLVDGRQLLFVVSGGRLRPIRERLNGTIDRGQRLVVAPMRFGAFRGEPIEQGVRHQAAERYYGISLRVLSIALEAESAAE